MTARRLRACRGALAAALACAACSAPGSGEGTTPTADDRMLTELRAFEAERRAAADFAVAPPSDRVLGADPYALRVLGSDRFVGLLRGTGAIVLLDQDLHELARATTPASPTGLALAGARAFVTGERTPEIAAYHVSRDRIDVAASIPLTVSGSAPALALRDVAAGPEGALYAVEDASGRLFTLLPSAAPGGYDITERPACAGAFRVARTPRALVIDCLIAHTILAYRVASNGLPEGEPATITNDGPLWSFAALDDADDLLIASGGVENKPLDRTHGSFENIDSFVYLDRIAWQGLSPAEPSPHITRLAEINVSEHGVIVPKALEIEKIGAATRLTVTGYGGGSFAMIDVSPSAAPIVHASPLPPGTTAFTRTADGSLFLANPLLDAWIRLRPDAASPAIVHVAGPGDATRTAASRLGEALLFTDLIAPWNSSSGPLSRFTCETCHFEGYVDGRTHATGRGAIRATTKPLLGLFNNRPHFSRALDPDLSSIAHNEFRVAGARSQHDPIFDFTLADRPYFTDLGVTASDLTASGLRRAFMTFLMDFTPRSSAFTAGRAAFTDVERRGAGVFRDRCESCHEARLSADVAASRVAFEGWEAKIFTMSAPVVWGQDRYEKTGVEPYVHDKGARVPSLRRLSKKQPYFTNGTAKTIADLLGRVRFGGESFFHDGAPAEAALEALSVEDRTQLEAFLRLL